MKKTTLLLLLFGLQFNSLSLSQAGPRGLQLQNLRQIFKASSKVSFAPSSAPFAISRAKGLNSEFRPQNLSAFSTLKARPLSHSDLLRLHPSKLALRPLQGSRFCHSSPNSSDIKTITSILEIKDLQEGAWVVLDLDDTLFKSHGHLGSGVWFKYLSRLYKLRGESDIEERMKLVWRQIQKYTEVVAVEEGTKSFIDNIRRQGLTVSALTARTPSQEVMESTHRHLTSLQIQLSGGAISKGDFTIGRESIGSTEDAAYNNLILFSGPTADKGKVFISFLKKMKMSPKRIVYVDDLKEHVESVRQAVMSLEIPYSGFHYVPHKSGSKTISSSIADDKDLTEVELKARLLAQLKDEKHSSIIWEIINSEPLRNKPPHL